MDDLCAPTLDALDEFIRTQKNLLSQTQSDIARLRLLKSQAAEDVEGFVENLGERLKDPAFKLSAREHDYGLKLPKPIQWGAFQGLDPTALQTLSSSLLATSISRARPAKSSRSPLSPLQSFVKTAKKSLVDPLFDKYGYVSDPEPEEEDPESIRREQEREKIRQLKRMQIRGGRAGKGKGGGGGGLKLPSNFGMLGVFVRNDVEDESAFEVDIDNDVDVAAPTLRSLLQGGKGAPAGKGKSYPSGKCPDIYEGLMEVDEEDQEDAHDPSLGPEIDLDIPPSPPPKHPTRTSARPKRTMGGKNAAFVITHEPAEDIDIDTNDFDLGHGDDQEGDDDNGFGYDARSSTSMRRSTSAKAPAHLLSASSTPQASTSRSKLKSKSGAGTTRKKRAAKGEDEDDALVTLKKEKPKPETYKQAWSDEEQRLLEQLLEEIPEGEKYRWQKISRAMGGRRTPRQVASRVQKYFEKLKRFGVG